MQLSWATVILSRWLRIPAFAFEIGPARVPGAPYLVEMWELPPIEAIGRAARWRQ